MIDPVSIKDVKIQIGRWCKHQRKRHELTQVELAEQLAVSRITIQNLENAKNPTLDTVLKVAVHFDELDTIHDLIKTDIDKDENIKSLY